MKDLKTILYFALLICFSRLIPHPPSFTALGASIVGTSILMNPRDSFQMIKNIFIPLLGILLSDLVLATNNVFFHDQILWVYGSVLLSSLILPLLFTKTKSNSLNTINSENKNSISSYSIVDLFQRSFVYSFVFFITTNFGVWKLNAGFYSSDFSGLIKCYIAGIPFALNDFISTLLYTTLVLVVFAWDKKTIQKTSSLQ